MRRGKKRLLDSFHPTSQALLVGWLLSRSRRRRKPTISRGPIEWANLFLISTLESLMVTLLLSSHPPPTLPPPLEPLPLSPSLDRSPLHWKLPRTTTSPTTRLTTRGNQRKGDKKYIFYSASSSPRATTSNRSSQLSQLFLHQSVSDLFYRGSALWMADCLAGWLSVCLLGPVTGSASIQIKFIVPQIGKRFPSHSIDGRLFVFLLRLPPHDLLTHDAVFPVFFFLTFTLFSSSIDIYPIILHKEF